MLWSAHSNQEGQHAFLSASKYHWVNYDDEKLDRVFIAAMAARRGTELHELAHNLIRLGVKLPRSPKALNMYVNDAIGYQMKSEQVLYYSDNAFGTADSIAYRRDTLRIHDLKTGVTPTSHHQLEVYAALFCLEYKFEPHNLNIILRIYQGDEIREFIGDPAEIKRIMGRIVSFDKRITAIRLEAMS